MKRFPLVLLCALLLAAACTGSHPETEAAKAAKQCYDLLLAGKYAAFVGQMAHADEYPEAYRAQLEENMKMFVGQMEREHQGIREVRIVNCTADAPSRTANAFLVLCFGDSTIEETVVPMQEVDGKWKMR